MLKKIIFTLFLALIIFSCGKKSDPIYQKKSGLIKTQVYGKSNS